MRDAETCRATDLRLVMDPEALVYGDMLHAVYWSLVGVGVRTTTGLVDQHVV